MLKREVSMFAAQGVDVDAPRAKRHKPTATTSSPGKEDTATPNGITTKTEAEDVEMVTEDKEVVVEKGLKLWQTVKDAVNKEARVLSVDFMRLPSKRQYPDYYMQIKHPISLDEIKQQLDAGAYTTFEGVRQDLETCFRNAKRYNIKESQIFKDAKALHKLVTKEYMKLTGSAGGANPEDGEAGGAAGSSDLEGEGGKKKKAPNMTRVLKSRLQKLVDKTDDSGRIRSAEFMDLPNRKQWALYYKTIKKPQCLENIFKRLKRKEYHTSLDFANDVELVFSNALEFNQEHTEIWEDAIVLRDYFRQLMSDLPSPFSIPAYASSDHSTKIKLKMPAPAVPSTSSPAQASTSMTVTPPSAPTAAAGTLLLRLPPQPSSSNTPPLPAASPAAMMSVVHPTSVITTPAPSATPRPTLPPLTTSQSTPTPAPNLTAAFSQAQYAAAYSHHYPNATYQPPHVSTPAASSNTLPNTNNIHPTARPSVPAQTQTQPQPIPTTVAPAAPVAPPTIVLPSKSPTPNILNHRSLEYVSLVTKPAGRRLDLDYRDGVKTWAVRLATGETSVHVSGVKFLQQRGDGEESNEEEDKEQNERQLSQDQEALPQQPVPQPQEEEEEEEEAPKEKPKRGRGRPRKHKRGKEVEIPKVNKGKAVAKSSNAYEEVQVKVNGSIIPPAVDPQEWDAELSIGSNILEVGEKGGVIWRVYLERLMV